MVDSLQRDLSSAGNSRSTVEQELAQRSAQGEQLQGELARLTDERRVTEERLREKEKLAEERLKEVNALQVEKVC